MATRDEKAKLAKMIKEAQQQLNKGGLSLQSRLQLEARIQALKEVQTLWK